MDPGAGRMAVAFVVDNLQFGYPGRPELVLKGLTFTVPLGAKVAIFGRSGVGKSTLLSVLGLLWEGELAGGSVCYHSGDHEGPWDYRQLDSSTTRAKLRLREFGFLFQWSGLLPHLTCEENIALPLVLHGWPRSAWQPRVYQLLVQAEHSPGELTNLAQRLGPFSGGQQRRIALLRALSHNPRVLFADEPLSNLDPRSAEAIIRVLALWHGGELFPGEAHEPRTLLLSTHDVEEAWNFCDWFLILNKEGKLAQGRLLSKAEITVEMVRKLVDHPDASP